MAEDYRKKYIDFFGKQYMAMYDVDLNDSKIDIHHLDHDKENNELWNLVAIPNDLHSKYHKLWFDVARYGHKVTDHMHGRQVDYWTYNAEIVDEYLSVLDKCADWMDMKFQAGFQIFNKQ